MTEEISQQRDFVQLLQKKYINQENTRKGILVVGLRSTGKTVGVLQSIADFPSDKMIYISPSSRAEGKKKSDVLNILKSYDADIIVVDEYSWLKDDYYGDYLTGYLAGKAEEGVKVIITGTDSAKISSLKNMDFIHRSFEINTTFFPYEEFCRVYKLEKDSDSMKKYLTQGGIFESNIYETFGSMKDYIKTAILENLCNYYPHYNTELVKAAVYTIFYESITEFGWMPESGTENVPVYNYSLENAINYDDYLAEYGINPNQKLPQMLLNEISNKMQEIGIVVRLNELEKSKSRSYITNQAISAQLVKSIYQLDKLDKKYLGHLFEASVVCDVYMKYVKPQYHRYEMNYLHGTGYEIDFLLHDKESAFLFECKMNDNDEMKINDSASIVKDIIPNLLGDKELCGRYIIYQGKEKYISANNKDLICTNNWRIKFEDFDDYLAQLKNDLENENENQR